MRPVEPQPESGRKPGAASAAWATEGQRAAASLCIASLGVALGIGWALASSPAPRPVARAEPDAPTASLRRSFAAVPTGGGPTELPCPRHELWEPPLLAQRDEALLFALEGGLPDPADSPCGLWEEIPGGGEEPAWLALAPPANRLRPPLCVRGEIGPPDLRSSAWVPR